MKKKTEKQELSNERDEAHAEDARRDADAQAVPRERARVCGDGRARTLGGGRMAHACDLSAESYAPIRR